MSEPGRVLRADARRNREMIIAAALEAFERDGVNASLDGIASAAGVGNATLYRNFPTREHLLFEALRHDIGELESTAELLQTTGSAGAGLFEWLQTLAWHLRIWHDLPASVVAALNDAASPLQMACGPLIARTAELVAKAKAEDTLTSDVEAGELFEMVTLLSWGIDHFGDSQTRARARVAMAFAGVVDAGPTTCREAGESC